MTYYLPPSHYIPGVDDPYTPGPEEEYAGTAEPGDDKPRGGDDAATDA